MIFLFDVYNCLFAGYHALKGQLIGAPARDIALYGFFRQLLGRVESNLGYYCVFLAFDHGQSDWRMKMFPEYKQQRHKYKSEQEQVEKEAIRSGVMEAVEFLWGLRNIMPWFSLRRDNTEADDLIAATRLHYKNTAAQIVSGDKDFRQLLLEPGTSIYSPVRSIDITRDNWNEYAAVKAKTGGSDEKIIVPILNYLAFRALSGDASDNIPGVAGIGEVTAARLCAIEHAFNPEELMHGGVSALLKERGIKQWKSIAKKLNTPKASEDYNRNFALMNLHLGAGQIPSVEGHVHRWEQPWDRVRSTFWDLLEQMKFKTIQSKFRAFDYMAERVST